MRMTDATDWRQAPASAEDVRQVFRMILGRDGADEEVQRFVERGVTVQQMRANVLQSPEFRNVMSSLQPAHPSPWQGRGLHLRDLGDRRIVFLHVPKCGGTTMHAMLTAWFGAEAMHPERGNQLYFSHISDLAGRKVFSGHYDYYATCLVPGRVCRLSLLREPVARLLSLYHFHRAHSRAFIERKNLKLARWASEYDIDAYFAHEAVRAEASIDNAIARNFSNVSQLPHLRKGPQGAQTVPLDEICRQAVENVATFDFIGFMDAYEASAAVIAELLGVAPLDRISPEQVLDDLMEREPNMQRIERQTPSPETLRDLEELVRYDREVYAAAERRFRPMIAARGRDGTGAPAAP
jgi:hypothetical protein